MNKLCTCGQTAGTFRPHKESCPIALQNRIAELEEVLQRVKDTFDDGYDSDVHHLTDIDAILGGGR